MGRKLGVTAVKLSAKGDVPLSNGSITTVPGKRQGKLAPRMAHVVSVHGEGPKLQKTVFKASTVPEAESTTVLRVSTEARYYTEQSWQQLVDKPAPCVRKWLQVHVPADKQRQVRDIWNLQYESAKVAVRPFSQRCFVLKALSSLSCSVSLAKEAGSLSP